MLIRLAEAASLLGVSKETLRNWDKNGKLRSVRDPNNNYRLYRLEDVQSIAPAVRDTRATYTSEERRTPAKGTEFKRALTKIHKVLRDTDANSSLIERFDELTKLIYLKARLEQSGSSANSLSPGPRENERQHAHRIRKLFDKEVAEYRTLFLDRFATLNLSDAALSAAATALADTNLLSEAHDVKGLAYEEMIRNTFEKGDNQQFFTPHPVVEFTVELLENHIQGIVCDPAAGTAGFLVEIAKRQLPADKLLALEIDERLAWVAGINLFLHSTQPFESKRLPNGGSLGAAGLEYEGTIDIIVTNPPFGSDFADQPDLQRYILGRGRPSRRRGVLFIERSLRMLREGGLLAMVIDEGVLSLPSNSDVRELILGQCDVLAVISLPETTFMPYASVATSIIVLRKNTLRRAPHMTFFAKAEHVGRKPNGDLDLTYDENGRPKLMSDLPRIAAAWRQFNKDRALDRHADEIYLANPSASLSASTENRLDFKFHHPARLAAQRGLSDSRFVLKTLSEICQVRNEAFVPSVDFADQMIPYTGLAHILPRSGLAQQVMVSGNSLKSSVKKYVKGDILFAKMRPTLRKVALVNFDEPGYASAECIVLTVRSDAEGEPLTDPFLLSILLRSDYVHGQIIHLISGIGRPRIALKDILQVKVPVPPRSLQSEFKSSFMMTRNTYDSLRVESRRLADLATLMELEAVETLAQSFVGRV